MKPTDVQLVTETKHLYWATAGLAIATFGLIFQAWRTTRTDRQRDDDRRKQDRKDAEKDLTAQRDHDRAQRDQDRTAAADRLREQRDHDDSQRDRDRADAAQRLAEQREYDEKQRQLDRKDAEQRLAEERADSDRRLREERQAAEDRATRQRQVEAATSLLQRIAEVDPFILHIPNLDQQTQGTPQQRAYEQARDAVGTLKKGALGEALALHNPVGTRLYQGLVMLYLGAIDGHWKRITRDVTPTLKDRAVGDLRHYTRHVRLCLFLLINTGDIPTEALGPDSEKPDIPRLARPLDEDPNPWTPTGWTPPGWDVDSELDLTDPTRRFDYYR